MLNTKRGFKKSFRSSCGLCLIPYINSVGRRNVCWRKIMFLDLSYVGGQIRTRIVLRRLSRSDDVLPPSGSYVCCASKTSSMMSHDSIMT
jgi:hypothetical protein